MVAVAEGGIDVLVGFGFSVEVGTEVSVATGIFVGTNVLITVGVVLTGSVVIACVEVCELHALKNTTNKAIMTSHTVFFFILFCSY
jgi:UDP-3-O-[3-hydroxymyristoyl] glucosamine N-acyltransferase